MPIARLIAFSAPSGAGKSTICQKLLKRHPDFQLSISATTRPPRYYENEGEHYFFLSPDSFQAKVDSGEFLEYEEVHGNYYGTLKPVVEAFLAEGKTILFDIDVNGALAIKAHYPDAMLIFIAPPSIEELQRRLRGRGSDDPAQIEKRLKRLPEEMEKGQQFDYIVVNKNLDQTVREIERLIFNS